MRRYQPVLLLIFLLMALPVSAKVVRVHSAENVNQITHVAHEIASAYHQMGWFSGSLLVTKGGEVIFSKSYGYQSVEEQIKNSVNTRYNLGSIMKNFTKVLVLQQVEAGKLNPDDTLNQFELGFPSDIAAKVTVQHLLDHRAGFGDIFIAEYRENQMAYDTLEKKLDLLRNKPLLFEPGTDQRYSNYGYIVLGAILEKITQSTFEKLLVTKIFVPLNLTQSALHPEAGDNNQSTRYAFMYDGSLRKVGITEHPGPDGGIEASVTDVQRFYRELFYGDKLLDSSAPLVRTAFAMDGPHWAAYGGGKGISAAAEVDLQNGVEIIVLANTDSLVAEFISGRIQAFVNTGTYPDITPRPINFLYSFYKEHGTQAMFKDFRQYYADSGYSQFIGRTVNELGMQLLESGSKDQAFDIFHYLVHLFPQAPQAYDSLAYAYYKTGNAEQASNTFQKALKLKGGFQSDYVSDNYVVSEVELSSESRVR